MVNKAHFAASMQEIAEEHHEQIGRDNWLEYGFLPSTDELYARWRARGGVRFPSRAEFELALNSIREQTCYDGIMGTGPQYVRARGGQCWLEAERLLENCAHEPERRAYALHVLDEALEYAKQEQGKAEHMVAGFATLRRAIMSGLRVRKLFDHIAAEFGLSRDPEFRAIAQQFDAAVANEHADQ